MSGADAQRVAAPNGAIPEQTFGDADGRADDRGAPGESATEMRRKRVTLLECVINFNETYTSAETVHQAKRYLEQRLFTEQGLREVLVPCMAEPRPELLGEVEISAAAIEVGERQRRVHVHFIMRIVHLDARIYIGRIPAQLIAHAKRLSTFSSPWASVRLLDAAAENYILKESSVPVNFYSAGNQTEKQQPLEPTTVND